MADLDRRLRRLRVEAWLFRALFLGALAFLFLRPPHPPVVEDAGSRAELRADGLHVTGPSGEARFTGAGLALAADGRKLTLEATGLRASAGGGTVDLAVHADGPHLHFLDRDNGQLDLGAAHVRFVCDGEIRVNARRGFPIGVTVAEGDAEAHFPQ